MRYRLCASKQRGLSMVSVRKEVKKDASTDFRPSEVSSLSLINLEREGDGGGGRTIL